MHDPLRRLFAPAAVALTLTLTACGGGQAAKPTTAPASTATVEAATRTPRPTAEPTTEPTAAPTAKPTVAPKATAAAGEVLPVEFSPLQTFKHPSGVFSIDIPDTWTLKDNSKADEIIHIWSDPTGNGAVIVDLFEDKTSYTADQLTQIITSFLKSQFGTEPDFVTKDPQTQKDGSILVVWSYTSKASNGTSVPLLGNSFIEQRENKVSILTTLVPSDQFDTVLPKTNEIINTYKIDPSVTLTTGSTAAPQATAAPGEVLPIEFGTLQTFKHPSGVFSIDIPENWTLKDNSKKDEIIHVWTDPTGNGAVIVDLFEDTKSYTADELTKIITTFLKNQFGTEPDFVTKDPKTQKDGSILVVWSYTSKASNGTSVPLLGNSFIEQRENKVSILTTLVPSDQFDTVVPKTDGIINTYKIDPTATLTTGV